MRTKRFAGPRVRHIRTERGLTQAALARRIGISPSYLNQIEHDERPLTIGVLVRLKDALGIDAGALADDLDARLVADLHEALADPDSGTGEAVAAGELREMVAAHPAIARAVVALHRRATGARRRVEEMAIGLGAHLPEGTALPVSPYDEVLDFVYDNRNHFPELEVAAEALAAEAGGPGLAPALELLLAERHGVRTLAGDDSEVRRSYDAERRELRLWRGLSERRRAVQLAVQWAHLELGDTLGRVTDVPGLSSEESRALARIGLASYFAAALALPYAPFRDAAEANGYDIGLLADRFGVSVETVCHRLSTLQRRGAAGVPFVFLRVDRAGNISKRHSATEFHFSRIGGNCALWNVHEAFSSPGRFITQVAEMPSGRTYFWVATTVGRRAGAYGTPGAEFAVALGCDVRHAERLVYSRGLALGDPRAAVPIGPGCRLCERAACHQRAFPLVGRPLDVRSNRTLATPYPAG